jgi:hypothetical protein
VKYVWETLSVPPSAESYPDSARPELLALIERAPRRVLELGCHRGALGAALKDRFHGLYHVGFEINAAAASQAAQRVDEVLVADFPARRRNVSTRFWLPIFWPLTRPVTRRLPIRSMRLYWPIFSNIYSILGPRWSSCAPA